MNMALANLPEMSGIHLTGMRCIILNKADQHLITWFWPEERAAFIKMSSRYVQNSSSGRFIALTILR